jgi:hypothetical protein
MGSSSPAKDVVGSRRDQYLYSIERRTREASKSLTDANGGGVGGPRSPDAVDGGQASSPIQHSGHQGAAAEGGHDHVTHTSHWTLPGHATVALGCPFVDPRLAGVHRVLKHSQHVPESPIEVPHTGKRTVRQQESPAPSPSEMDPVLYIVDHIVRRRCRHGQIEYLVHWVGFEDLGAEVDALGGLPDPCGRLRGAATRCRFVCVEGPALLHCLHPSGFWQ